MSQVTTVTTRGTPLLAAPASEPSDSSSLNPSDHVRMIVELLQPAGPDLARRWLAALMLVDRAERELVVESIERQIVAAYVPTDIPRRVAGEPAPGWGAGSAAVARKKQGG